MTLKKTFSFQNSDKLGTIYKHLRILYTILCIFLTIRITCIEINLITQHFIILKLWVYY